MAGQETIQFIATTDASQLLQNSHFEVSFTLSNANGTNFVPPDLSQFQILAGPNKSSSMQVINGVVSSEMTYAYTLRAKTTGKLTIKPASIKVNNKTLSSNELTVEVLESIQKMPSEDDPFFIRLELKGSDEVYVGQQMILDYKLYTTVSIEGYDIVEDANLNGFYSMELKSFSSRPTREVLNGRQYTTKILRRIAIYPQQSGRLFIGPAQIQLAVPEEDGHSRFFFNRRIRPAYTTTNTLQVESKQIPPNPPPAFAGGVGNFQYHHEIDKDSISTDEAATLRITYSGYGDFKRISLPQINVPPSLDLYPPDIVEEKFTETSLGILGERTIAYSIIPKEPGEFTIRTAFPYFDPEAKDYQNIEEHSITIRVSQGEGKSEMTAGEMPSWEVTKEDIRPMRPSIEPPVSNSYLIRKPGFWLVAILAPFLFVTGIGYQYGRKKPIMSADAMQRAKLSAAYNQLKNVDRSLEQNSDQRLFFEALSNAVGSYVRIKFDIPPANYSKNEVTSAMKSNKVPDDWIDDYLEIMQRCELAIFAPTDESKSNNDILEKAIRLIGNLEEL